MPITHGCGAWNVHDSDGDVVTNAGRGDVVVVGCREEGTPPTEAGGVELRGKEEGVPELGTEAGAQGHRVSAVPAGARLEGSLKEGAGQVEN